MDPFRPRPDLVSIWELGLRLHDCDPDQLNHSELSAEVRETLREIILSADSHFNLFDVTGKELLAVYIPIVRIIKEHPVVQKIIEAGHSRRYDKELLDQAFISSREFKRWALDYDRKLPEFWFNPQDIHLHDQELAKRWGKLPPENRASPQHEPKKSKRHVEAAKARHAPLQKIFDVFVLYYQNGIFPSKAEAARRFLRELPAEQRKLLSMDRAERTLTDHLSRHLKQQNPSKK